MSPEAFGCLGVLTTGVVVIVWAVVIQSGGPLVMGVVVTVSFLVHVYKVETRRREEAERKDWYE